MQDAQPAQVMALAVSQRATLGEGLFWDESRSLWWWTDIEGSTLHAWSIGAAEIRSFRMHDRVGSFVRCRSGKLLLGLTKRLAFAVVPDDASSQRQMQLETIVPVDPAEQRTRINDGRTDRRGYFVFGTINEAADKRPIGSFYQYSLKYGLRRLALPAVSIANSICFSRDGETMYFSDTLTRCIMQCRYDAESALVSEMRVFVEIPERHAFPDGSVIDRNGCLWNAQWGASRVAQYAPDGSLMQTISVPAKHVSCPAIGGPHGDQLMVTTARAELRADQLERLPLSGSLFGMSLPQPLALADTLFDDRPVTEMNSER
ncbi:MAG TPA: SMP-30/gluconolactonase/LRE family protein [Burkholderiaceae bacterium]